MNKQPNPYFSNIHKLRSHQNQSFAQNQQKGINEPQNPVNRRMSENLQQIINQQSKGESSRQYKHNLFKVNQLSQNKTNNAVSRDRSLTPTITNISDIEDRYKKVQSILNNQNGNLKAQNDYIKAQVKRLYQKQKKHKATIKKYKIIVEQLKLQNQIYQNRYEQLKAYVGQLILKLSQFQQNESNEQIFQFSNEMVDNLKRQFSLQNILVQGKKNCSSSKITSDIEETVTYQQDNLTQNFNIIKELQNHKKSNDSFNGINKDSNQINHNDQQQIQLFQILKGKKQIDQSKPYFNYFNKNQEITKQLCSQKMQELSDQFQALMYQYKKSNNKDKGIRKKAIEISQQIKRIKQIKQEYKIQNM